MLTKGWGYIGQDWKTPLQPQVEELAQVAGHLTAREEECDISASVSKHSSKYHLLTVPPCTGHGLEDSVKPSEWPEKNAPIIPKKSPLHFPASGRTPSNENGNQ